MQQREPERRLDGRRAEVALDPFQDRVEPDELARRVQIEQAVDERLAALDDREAIAKISAGHVRVVRDRARQGEVVIVERCRPLIGAPALAAADRAAVVLAGWDGVGVFLVGRLSPAPDELVGREHPLAGGTAGREQLADPDLEARLAARRSGHRLERRIKVAEVGWPEDELGEEPRQRARFEADRRPLAGNRGVGHPAAPAVEVEDDVARRGVGLDAGDDERRWRCRRETIEKREREPGLCSDEGRATCHLQRTRPGWGPPALRLVELVRLFFERLVRRGLRRQDAVEILDLLVLLVVLEVLLELHLLADERPLRVRPEVGRLGRCRERDLAVVAGVLVDLADDDPDVLVAERSDARRRTCCRRR